MGKQGLMQADSFSSVSDSMSTIGSAKLEWGAAAWAFVDIRGQCDQSSAVFARDLAHFLIVTAFLFVHVFAVAVRLGNLHYTFCSFFVCLCWHEFPFGLTHRPYLLGLYADAELVDSNIGAFLYRLIVYAICNRCSVTGNNSYYVRCAISPRT